MTPYRLTPQARDDLRVIWDYIAEDNPNAADRLLNRFEQAFHLLGTMPNVGHKREDLAPPDVYFWPVSSYLVIYRKSVPLIVLAVLHGGRDIAPLIESR